MVCFPACGEIHCRSAKEDYSRVIVCGMSILGVSDCMWPLKKLDLSNLFIYAYLVIHLHE